MFVWMGMCASVNVYMCMCVCMWMCIYNYICMCVSVYMHIYACVETKDQHKLLFFIFLLFFSSFPFSFRKSVLTEPGTH